LSVNLLINSLTVLHGVSRLALSTEQLLKKDMKSFTVSSTCVIMSSLHVSIQVSVQVNSC